VIAFVYWFQEALTLSQTVARDIPSLGTIITSVAGGAILYGLRVLDQKLDVLVELRDKTRAMWTAIYGEKDASEPSGLIHETHETCHEVRTLRGDFKAHTTEEAVWQQELSRNSIRQANDAQRGISELGTRLDGIEDRLTKWRDPR